MNNYAEVKRNIMRNTISNYVRTLVGLTVGLVTFRLIYHLLSKEEFGFWSLLWSVFGYGVLLDFGFGFAAQKKVAELSVAKDWAALSRALSTILFFYFGVAALMGLSVLLFSHQIITWLGVTADNAEQFRQLLIVFIIGIGLAFPMGVFPEILRGQQRIRLANYITSGFMLLRLGLLLVATWLHWGLMEVMLIALVTSLLPDFVAMPVALRWMPEVRISPRLFSRSEITATASFSLFAYLATATNLVLSKADQIVLASTLGVGAIAVYQAGAKVAEIFREFAKQMQDSISPAAAHLHANNDHQSLRDLLVRTTRWAAITSTPLYLLCAFYMRELIMVLTGDTVVNPDTYLTGQAILLWFCTGLYTHSVQRIYIVTGRERHLVKLGFIEAILNLTLSVSLLLIFRNVTCVALGSLIPTLYVGWFLIWPGLAKDTHMSVWQLFRSTIMPVWAASVPVIAVLVALHFIPSLQFSSTWATLLIHGPIAGLLSIIMLWRVAMTEGERSLISRKLPILRRFAAAPMPKAELL